MGASEIAYAVMVLGGCLKKGRPGGVYSLSLGLRRGLVISDGKNGINKREFIGLLKKSFAATQSRVSHEALIFLYVHLSLVLIYVYLNWFQYQSFNPFCSKSLNRLA